MRRPLCVAVGAFTLAAACVDTGGLSGTVSDAGDDGARDASDGGVTDGGDAGDATDDQGADVELGYADAVLADGPKAYWRLDEKTTSSMVHDATGSGNEGSFSGAPKLGVQGAVSGSTAIHFDGQSIHFQQKFGFEGTASFTIEAWINPTVDGNYHAFVARNDRDSSGANVYEGWTMVVDPAPAPKIRVTRLHLGATDTVSVTTFSPGSWNHVVATYDGLTLALHVNVTNVATTPAVQPLGIVVRELSIGGDTGGSSSPFLGDIDEVAIYDHVLTDAQIAKHYGLRAK